MSPGISNPVLRYLCSDQVPPSDIFMTDLEHKGGASTKGKLMAFSVSRNSTPTNAHITNVFLLTDQRDAPHFPDGRQPKEKSDILQNRK